MVIGVQRVDPVAHFDELETTLLQVESGVQRDGDRKTDQRADQRNDARRLCITVATGQQYRHTGDDRRPDGEAQ